MPEDENTRLLREANTYYELEPAEDAEEYPYAMRLVEAGGMHALILNLDVRGMRPALVSMLRTMRTWECHGPDQEKKRDALYNLMEVIRGAADWCELDIPREMIEG